MPAPGTVKPRRYFPRFHWELLACGVSGHQLVGVGAVQLRPQDAVFAREMDGLRWHRCLRCDSWLPFEPPEHPESQYPPDRDAIELPLRGRPLRDKIVLRVIAIDRGFHFVVLALLSAAIFLFAANQRALRDTFYQVVTDVQQGFGGGPVHNSQTGFLHELDKVFSLQGGQLHLLGAAVGAYAVLELVEAVGLWMGNRWAEYLTFIATAVFLPLEVYEADQEHLGPEDHRVRHQRGHRRLPALRQAAVRPARRGQGGGGAARARRGLGGAGALGAARARGPGLMRAVP